MPTPPKKIQADPPRPKPNLMYETHGVITFTEITIFLKFLSKLNYKNLWK